MSFGCPYAFEELVIVELPSFDLVYSGQSIDHVTEAEADKVLAEVRRVLRPGGILAVDTPNGPVCRLHQAEFIIDPDREIERCYLLGYVCTPDV